MEHEVTESQKNPPKGLLKPQTNLDAIALSAVNVKALIVPVGDKKSPLIQRWQEPGAGSYKKSQLERWRARYNNPRWGIPCGPGSETTPGNMILVTDVDFQKDKDKKPIGLPILGPVPYKLLEQASFSQQTASLYQGKRTYQFFWPWEDRFKILSNSRLAGTTIDIRTAKGQVVLYRPLPPLDIWENLNSMPDDLFEIIKTLSRESSKNDWKQGNRNNTLFTKIAFDLERNQGRNIPAIIEKAKAVGLSDREIQQTAISAVKTAIKGDHGIDPGPELNGATPTKGPAREAGPSKDIPPLAMWLKKTLDKMGCELRLNTRKDRIEIKGFKSKSWAEVTDEGFSTLYLKVRKQKKLPKNLFEDMYKSLAESKSLDPFHEYLNKLEWDKKPRLKRFLFEVFDIPEPGHIPLAEWAFKSILLATVRRTFMPGSKHDEFVVFKGVQGIGKSTFLYQLFEDKSLFSSSINFNSSSKELVEVTLGKAIIEVAELSGVKKTALERLKNIITLQHDTVRLAWRKHARDYLRRFIFVGTTNDDKPLPDDLTGLRRFVLISLKWKLTDLELKKLVKENRDQLWAEAVHCFKNGESARLPKELWIKSAEVAETHRGGDHSFEEEFLKEVGEKPQVRIKEILKVMKDGEIETVQYEKNGQIQDYERKKLGTGGWIRDITPNYQQKAAELLKKAGYIDGKIYEKGKQIRIWTLKKKP